MLMYIVQAIQLEVISLKSKNNIFQESMFGQQLKKN